jgi:hypothetical protein
MIEGGLVEKAKEAAVAMDIANTKELIQTDIAGVIIDEMDINLDDEDEVDNLQTEIVKILDLHTSEYYEPPEISDGVIQFEETCDHAKEAGEDPYVTKEGNPFEMEDIPLIPGVLPSGDNNDHDTGDENEEPRAMVYGGYEHAVIVDDGKIKVIGYNERGELGLGHTNEVFEFTEVLGIEGVKSVAGGMLFTILLMEDGTIMGAGWNGYWPFGLADYSIEYHTFTQIEGITGVKEIAAGQFHTVLLMDDGTIKVTGHGSDRVGSRK